MIRPPLRRRSLLAAAASAALASVPRAGALAFPERPLRWIVAHPAGDGSDAVARGLGSRIEQRIAPVPST